MKQLNKRTIVEVESRVNDKILVGGKEFLLDTAFREYWNTMQMASVVSSDMDELEPGDIVYVHHFVNAPEQKLPIKGNLSFLEFNQIYCRKREGEMKVLANYVLVEPVTYESAGISQKSNGLRLSSKSDNERLERVGVASLLSDNAIAEGLEVGDKILFNKNCEYEILVEGKLYYRMETRDVITTIDKWSDLTL